MIGASGISQHHKTRLKVPGRRPKYHNGNSDEGIKEQITRKTDKTFFRNGSKTMTLFPELVKAFNTSVRI
jgi:hypothetical protein